MSATTRLRELGQSVWLDSLDRHLVTSGELGRLIDEDGVSGLTSNPTIFQKAIRSSNDYDATIASAPPKVSDSELFENIEVYDVGLACDAFAGVYRERKGDDGFVSIEVSPTLAHDTDGSIEAAHRLAARLKRPNAMIKIPGTREGIAAIEQCLSDGLNVNITLLFSVARYEAIVETYLTALERRLGAGRPIDEVASVASFFVSRVDVKVDAEIDRISASSGSKGECARALRGKIAIANAKLAYDTYRRRFEGPRWRALEKEGARPQRVLWASTSTKDPSLPPLYYAEALIGRGTIDTMTPATLRAYLSQGKPEPRLEGSGEEGSTFLDDLATVGLDLETITDELESEGVAKFAKSYDDALAAIGQKRNAKTTASLRP